MSKVLVVAEKPSVARDIARVLGASARGDGYVENALYIITWAIGHLVTLMDPGEMNPAWQKWSMAGLPMLPDTLPTKVIEATKKQFGIIKKLMKQKDVSSIVCATDAGREGELIFRLIYDQAGCKKPVQRLWISSLTSEAIRDGFDHLVPGSAYDALYLSAKCRSEADWLVGMNASRAFTLRYDALLTIGRVQTPTLAILVKRRLEIDAFVPEDYFEVTAQFEDYSGIYVKDGTQDTHIEKEEVAKAIISQVKGKQGRVTLSERQVKKTPPPPLYDLTSLQRDANGKYGFSADRTLKVAQALYETHKLLTYPRTDSRHLPKDMAPKLQTTLGKLPEPYATIAQPILEKGALPMLPRVFDDKKVTDHHAIVPTGAQKPLDALAPDERKLFDLVARRTLAVFYPDYVYEAAKVLTAVTEYTFLSRGNMPMHAGWKACYEDEAQAKAATSKTAKKEEEATLPALAVGDMRTVQKATSAHKKTKPPAEMNDSSLLGAMESAGKEIEDEALRERMKGSGLGTPATRAATIERLIQVGYVTRVGKALRATDKGIKLIAAVPPEIASPETTGKWEKGLYDIAKGEMDHQKFMTSIQKFCVYLTKYAKEQAKDVGIEPEKTRGAKPAPKSKASKPAKKKSVSPSAPSAAQNAQEDAPTCPLCHKPILESPRAFGCSGWKEGCTFVLKKDAVKGQVISPATARMLLNTGQAILGNQTLRLEQGTLHIT